jgi:uncharacterized protein YbjT (DUF2867 family)
MSPPAHAQQQRVLVTGGTGFVGQALLPVLVASGYLVRATTRDVAKAAAIPGVEWVECDVEQRRDLDNALSEVDAAFFLVHGMGSGNSDYAEAEQHTALGFREAVASSAARRIVFLGGVEPAGTPSEHLKSRLRVGQILREGAVPTLELRASMIIGNGSTSWRIVRDLALRLPAMLLPAWTDSRTCPIDIEDVTVALQRGLELELPESAWYDIPGPDVLSAREILMRVAALGGRHVPSLRVPFLSVSLSSWWLKLVTRADFAVARELVLGLSQDLLPSSDQYWERIGYRPKYDFEASARRALAAERGSEKSGLAARLEEAIVQLVGLKLPR